MFIRLTSKDAPLMGPFHTLISLKVKRWHNSNLQRENVKGGEQWFKTWKYVYSSFHFFVCDPLWPHCHFGTSRPGSVPGAKHRPSFLLSIFSFTTRDVPRPVANAHLFVEECPLLMFGELHNWNVHQFPPDRSGAIHDPSRTGKRCFYRFPDVSDISETDETLGWFHLCEKSILRTHMLLARYFWMRGWVHRRRESSRHFPL